MKKRAILILVLLTALLPLTSSALNKTGNSSTPDNEIGSPNSEQDDNTVVVITPSAVPLDLKEPLQDYETEMAEVTRRFSVTLLQITDAVQRGELTSEQGQQISAEQYQVA